MSKLSSGLASCFIISTVVLGGCATVFKSKTTPVSITSNTPGAEVIVDGKSVGVTPTTVELSNKNDTNITVKTAGKEETCKVTTSASTGWIVADVFLTTGLGIIVDAVTHNWNNLGSTTCHASV